MARTSSQLRVSFVVDTGGLRSGFGRATKETDRFGRSTQRTARSTNAVGVSLGRAAVAAAGAAAAFVPLSLAISQTARSTIEFDRSMRNVNSIAQLSEGRFQNLSKSVLDLAGPTAQAPRTLADGLYDLVSSGFESKEALDVLAVSAKAATAGLTETEVSTKTVAAVLNAYRLPARRAAAVSDVLFRTVDRGVISFEQLSTDIGDVLPFASSLGVRLEEVGASTATMTKAGIGSSETMTRIKNVMVTLLKPGSDLASAMESIGYESGEAMIEALGFQGTLDALMRTTDGSKNAVAELFPNIRALGGVLALTGENSRNAAQDLRGMEQAAGATDRALSQQSKSISYQWQRLKSTTEALAIEFGSTLVPAIRDAIKVLNDDSLTIAEKFSVMRDQVIKAIRDLAPMAAQAAGEVGIVIAQSMAKAFAETGLLGKLTIAALTVRMLGGPKAILAAGAAAGALYSKGMQAAMTNVYAYKNARAAGFGAMASGGALATSIAGGLGKSLARAIPPVMAALAIGDILLTAIAGDLRSAALKGGGAVIGGALGAAFGPAGIAIGAGLGVIGAGIIQDIVGGAEKEAPKMRERIAATVDRLAAAAGRERGAYRQLASASSFLVDSRKRQKDATDRVRDAERNLARARARFGPNSEQAIRAARQLARAQANVARQTERARNAEKVYGTLRRATKNILRSAITDQKVELVNLRMKQQRLGALVREQPRNVAISKAYAQVTRAIDKGQKELNRSYLEAGQKVGPKFANSLRRIDGRAESLREAVAKLRTGVKLNTRDMSKAYIRELEAMLVKTASATQVLNSDGQISVVQTGAGGPSGPVPRRRGGGAIRGSGRMVTAAVSPGELISYKGREIYVPGRPEPRDSVLMNLPVGAKVFTRDGQMRRALGATDAQALRDQAPHFAEGGIVRPQMLGGIPGPRRVANTGFGEVYKAAVAYYRRNSLSDLASAVRLAARFGLGVSSGYRPGDDGYHGVDRARDFVGSAAEMYRFANFVGTRFGSKLLELIYSPLGWSIKNGARTAPYAVADHYDHVHLAMRNGGIIPRFGKGGWVKTGYTVFDDTGGGYLGHLQKGRGYAELGTATQGGSATGVGFIAQALGMPGELADKFPLEVKINGRTRRMYKRDRGYGQGTSAYSIDIYKDSWRYFGIDGNSKGVAHIRPAATKEQIEAVKDSANKVAGRIQKSGQNRGARGYLKAAKKNVKKARRMASRGNIWGADDRLEKARDQITKANKNRRPKPSRNDNKKPPPSNIDGPVGALLDLAGTRGISRDTRETLLSNALAIAQGTEATTEDDLAVLRAQKRFQQGIRKTARRRLRTAAKKLRSDNLSNKERRKFRGMRNEALQNLGASASEIASINSDLREARGGGDDAADLAEAMKDLADAIKEQNELARGVQATSSREALRMLSDVISGQIVGKRISPSTTPQGVRY